MVQFHASRPSLVTRALCRRPQQANCSPALRGSNVRIHVAFGIVLGFSLRVSVEVRPWLLCHPSVVPQPSQRNSWVKSTDWKLEASRDCTGWVGTPPRHEGRRMSGVGAARLRGSQLLPCMVHGAGTLCWAVHMAALPRLQGRGERSMAVGKRGVPKLQRKVLKDKETQERQRELVREAKARNASAMDRHVIQAYKVARRPASLSACTCAHCCVPLWRSQRATLTTWIAGAGSGRGHAEKGPLTERQRSAVSLCLG